MKIHSIDGGGGTRLHVRECGKAAAPAILFIHGWSQSHLCWCRQLESELADEFRLVVFDLRGHGMSEKPLAPECYTNAQAWADDIAAIIDNLELRPLVLVGWSYGGLVICDYLRSFGQEHIAGIKFVAAAVTLNPAAFGTLIGPGFLHHVPGATADDLSANIEAIRAFVRGLAARPLSPEDSERVLCWNMVVPAEIRRALINRWIDSDDVLRALHKPVLLAHGRYDTVILPPMSEHILKTCPNSRSSWYEAAGHAPFLENAPRFNRELAQFVRETACVT